MEQLQLLHVKAKKLGKVGYRRDSQKLRGTHFEKFGWGGRGLIQIFKIFVTDLS